MLFGQTNASRLRALGVVAASFFVFHKKDIANDPATTLLERWWKRPNLERITDSEIEIDVLPFKISNCPAIVFWTTWVMKGCGHIETDDEKAKV